MREKWLLSIYKEIENFLQNMAITDAKPALGIKWKVASTLSMAFVLKPLPQTQQTASDTDQHYKHKFDWSYAATLLHGESLQ